MRHLPQVAASKGDLMTMENTTREDKTAWNATQEAPRRMGRPVAKTPRLGRIASTGSDLLEIDVYNLLRRALMRGAIQPDAVLSTRSLADELGISSMPVRGALKRLEAEHVIISRPRSGYRIAPLDATLYVEMTEIRAELEGMAAARAAERIDARGLDRVRRWNKALLQPGISASRMLRRNHGFHFEVYSAAGSSMLLSNIEMYWVRIGPALYSSVTQYDQARIRPVHNALVNALTERDAMAAEQAIRDDLHTACEAIVKVLESANHTQKEPAT